MFFWERIADQKIREAQREGQFDNLPGQGRPIDLKEYFSIAGEWRMAYDLLKKSGVMPGEMQLKKEIEQLEQQLRAESKEAIAELLKRDLAFKRIELELMMEKRRQRSSGR